MTKQEQELAKEIARLKAENEKLKPKAPKVSMKVTEKGGVSLYGMGRFPVTLYKSQWLKLIEKVKTGELEKFIQENESKLTDKQ